MAQCARNTRRGGTDMARMARELSICTMVMGLICSCGDNGNNSVTDTATTDTGPSIDSVTPEDAPTTADTPTAPDTPTTGECTNDADCDDGIECTSDVCKSDGTCLNGLADDVCQIDGVCMASGTVNPVNECEVCDATNFTDQWTPRPAILCNDGDPCTIESHCNKGVCVGETMKSCCGNGEVEAGETCDGDCPTECIPNGPCKAVYEVMGSPETCDVVCKIGPIMECKSDDGCCPKGCANATDNDCVASCGNKALDPGELCDGDCPTACFNSNACAEVKLEGDPSTCDSQCVKTDVSACISGDGCCPVGCNATSDADCAAHPCELEIDIQCNNSQAYPATYQITALDPEQPDGMTPNGYLFWKFGDETIGFDDTNCPAGYQCKKNQCVALVSCDPPCSSEESCEQGQCMPVGPPPAPKSCVNNADCDPKEYCDQMVCTAKKPTGTVCEESNECLTDKCKDMGQTDGTGNALKECVCKTDYLINFCLKKTNTFSLKQKTGCVVATFEIGTCSPLSYPKTCQAKQCYSCP